MIPFLMPLIAQQKPSLSQNKPFQVVEKHACPNTSWNDFMGWLRLLYTKTQTHYKRQSLSDWVLRVSS